MEKVVGNVESKSRKGNGIKVDGEWYSTRTPAELAHIEWKDDVEFLYEQNGKYRNIKGKVTKVGGGSSSGGGSRPAGGGYSNVGVEVGHAANLAIRMMEQGDEKHEVGSPDYYKTFTEYTVNMYKVMKAIRAKVEASGEDKPAPASKSAASDISDDDLF